MAQSNIHLYLYQDRYYGKNAHIKKYSYYYLDFH